MHGWAGVRSSCGLLGLLHRSVCMIPTAQAQCKCRRFMSHEECSGFVSVKIPAGCLPRGVWGASKSSGSLAMPCLGVSCSASVSVQIRCVIRCVIEA